MRLKIELDVNHLSLPLSYKHIIQGTIYNMLDRNGLGHFYHDEGYQLNEKNYKLFVFSDLFGKYIIKEKNIVYESHVILYISSLDNKWIKHLYDFLLRNDVLIINNQKATIVDISLNDLPYFKNEKEITIKTISPIVTYTSKDKYFTYYKPSDEQFLSLVMENIKNKCIAYKYPFFNILLDIKHIQYEKKKIVYFKNTFYQAYQSEIRILTNYDTLKVIYDTGLSAKGSCGFGMITIKDEKDILSL